MTIIFFLLFNHSVHQNFNCVTCHNNETNKELISNKNTNKNCKNCHKEKRTKFKLRLDNTINFNHKTHIFIDCKNCHIKKDNYKIINPSMDSCMSCHTEKKQNCKYCHKYKNNKLKLKLKNKFFKPKSHYNANFSTFHIVNDEKSCLSCHKKQYCINCHTAKKKITSFHNEDYLTIHKYELNFGSCQSCHKNNNDCKACHQKTGIDTTKKREIKNYKIHPKNWIHGESARKDITKCISCHTEKDCLKCHKNDENPHKQINNICEQKNKVKNSCLKCHKENYIKENCY